MTGVNEAVTAPPICPPMFMKPETEPENGPAISAVIDQYELWETYKRARTCGEHNTGEPCAVNMGANDNNDGRQCRSECCLRRSARVACRPGASANR